MEVVLYKSPVTGDFDEEIGKRKEFIIWEMTNIEDIADLVHRELVIEQVLVSKEEITSLMEEMIRHLESSKDESVAYLVGSNPTSRYFLEIRKV